MSNLGKPRPNHREYLRVLRRMTPAQRLRKAFELSELAKRFFVHGLRQRFSGVDEVEFQRILRERLAKCHNRNY